MLYVTEKDCISVMEAVLNGKKFDIVSFTLQEFADVKGFHGNHALLQITAKLDMSEKQFNFFVKLATMNQDVFDRYTGRANMFLKEHIMITKLMKDLERTVDMKLTSTCYLSRLNKFMVLENLSDIGFEVIRHKGGYDYAHAKLAVQAVADFHAASLLLEERGFKISEKYPDLLKESFFAKPEGDNSDECLIESCHRGVTKWAEKMTPDIPENLRTSALLKVYNTVSEIGKPSKDYRNVMCHGDLWGNNIMFKYEENIPKRGILVDFQAARYAPPAVDLSTFLYVALNTSLREEHELDLKHIYYARLTETLASLGADSESVLPRSEFEASCRNYQEFGICMRLYYSYITRVPGKYLQRAVEDVEAFLGFMVGGDPTIALDASNDKVYREELCDAIREVVKYYTGYISKLDQK